METNFIMLDDVADNLRQLPATSGFINGRAIRAADDRFESVVITGISDRPLGSETIGRWRRVDPPSAASLAKSPADPFPLLLLCPEADGPYELYRVDTAELLTPLVISPFKNDFLARVAPILGNQSLAGKRATIVGVGSVGSCAADQLNRSGIGGFILVDTDRVTAPNLCRTIYERSDIGRLKVDALADHLREVNPSAVIDVKAADITGLSEDELTTLVSQSDVIVAATDSVQAQTLINALAFQATPVVYVGMYPGAHTGEIIFTLPNQTACYECILGEILQQPNAPDRGQPDYGRVDRLMAEPGLGPDIIHVTAAAVKIALAILTRQDPLANLGEIIRPTRNLLLIGNKPEWIFGESFQTTWVETTRHEDCPACGTAQEIAS